MKTNNANAARDLTAHAKGRASTTHAIERTLIFLLKLVLRIARNDRYVVISNNFKNFLPIIIL